MGTFDVAHPDVKDFIRAKREDGRLRQFNLSLLITDGFMHAVENDADWPLLFPINLKEKDEIDLDDPAKVIWREWPTHKNYVTRDDGLVACKIYGQIRAKHLWDMIMTSTYDYAEPGFILIDRVNEMNNNWWCENIRATNPCGEQPLPPYGSCLLGSVNLTTFVRDPFGPKARFDWDEYKEVVRVFTRMLDNVVEINGLPLRAAARRNPAQAPPRHGLPRPRQHDDDAEDELRLARNPANSPSRSRATWRRRLGSRAVAGRGKRPGADHDTRNSRSPPRCCASARKWSQDGYKVGDKIPGRCCTPRTAATCSAWPASRRNWSSSWPRPARASPTTARSRRPARSRCRWPTTPATASSRRFAHHYSRNVIREGKKSKEKVEVFSYELLAYRELINAKAMPGSDEPDEKLPDYFVAADDISPVEHVDIQAAAQMWVDSSISKTANVPTDYPYEDFKDIYRYAHQQGLKGCTTFRFNPAAFQGVLVKEADLENTLYRFELEDGTVIEAKGNEEIEYDGEMHTAANLFDALKEGYYGKF